MCVANGNAKFFWVLGGVELTVINDATDGTPWLEVPWEQVPLETLRALIEEFVTRDGTDYGQQEATLDAKVSQVQAQLRRGEVLILFDTLSETVNLLSRREFHERLQAFRASS